MGCICTPPRPLFFSSTTSMLSSPVHFFPSFFAISLLLGRRTTLSILFYPCLSLPILAHHHLFFYTEIEFINLTPRCKDTLFRGLDQSLLFSLTHRHNLSFSAETRIDSYSYHLNPLHTRFGESESRCHTQDVIHWRQLSRTRDRTLSANT